MDIHHPYAVHNVNKYCTVGTIKRTLKHFLYFECFILHRLAGEEEILSNVLYEFYVLLPLIKAINLQRVGDMRQSNMGWSSGKEQIPAS